MVRLKQLTHSAWLMSRPAKAIIDLGAIVANYCLAKSLAPKSRALAVIKANAYGHGAEAVAKALETHADGFAVASLEEALALRAVGIQQRLLLLEGFFHPDELPLIDQHGLDICVHSQYQIEDLAAFSFANPLHIWLKIDTGMHRLGFQPEQASVAAEQLRRIDAVAELIYMSHLARADETTDSFTREQLTRFNQTVPAEATTSLANSPGILSWPGSHGSWLRPGMMLYGASPLDQENTPSRQLIPAMSLVSKVIAVKQLETGEAIGYGGSFVCPYPMKIAVVAMGYGDGYPRNAPAGTPILVNGQRCRLVGRVSMDMLTADISHLPDCPIGAEVECWGKQVNVKEVANHCDTIPYELVTRLTGRAQRLYL